MCVLFRHSQAECMGELAVDVENKSSEMPTNKTYPKTQ